MRRDDGITSKRRDGEGMKDGEAHKRASSKGQETKQVNHGRSFDQSRATKP